MSVTVQKYQASDVPDITRIWNEIVENGDTFPEDEKLDIKTARDFLANQVYCGVAKDESDAVIGFYILAAAGSGRCKHVATACYGVTAYCRGLHHGGLLVKDSLFKAIEYGFDTMRLDEVTVSNIHAIHLFERMGFKQLGVVPKGFRKDDGTLEDTLIFARALV